MKATDLMIGDYVTFSDCIDNPPLIIVKIEALGYQEGGGEDSSLVRIDNEKACDIIDIDDGIVGIPLTPEILEKNGWCEESDYENDIYGGHFPEDKEHRLELDVDGSEVWWTINCGENYIIPLHYVHELQHALKLCGIDKKIVL